MHWEAIIGGCLSSLPPTLLPTALRGVSGNPEALTALVWTGQESSAIWTGMLDLGPQGEGFVGQKASKGDGLFLRRILSGWF